MTHAIKLTQALLLSALALALFCGAKPAQAQAYSEEVHGGQVVYPSGTNVYAAANWTFDGNVRVLIGAFYKEQSDGSVTDTVGPAGMLFRVALTCYANPQHSDEGTWVGSGWSSRLQTFACPDHLPYGDDPGVAVYSPDSSTTFQYGQR